MYRPRVQGLQVGQVLVIRNSDDHERKYQALLLQGQYRLTDAWTVAGNWTWQTTDADAFHWRPVVEWEDMLNSKFKYGPDLLYTDVAKMTWGPFRTLKPPMPSQHDIFKDPPDVPTV